MFVPPQLQIILASPTWAVSGHKVVSTLGVYMTRPGSPCVAARAATGTLPVPCYTMLHADFFFSQCVKRTLGKQGALGKWTLIRNPAWPRTKDLVLGPGGTIDTDERRGMLTRTLPLLIDGCEWQ